MILYHYFDKTIGPFKNLSDLSCEEANRVLKEIAITKPKVQCARRNADYMQARIYYENILRNEFQKKGGLISRQVPHYIVVEHSPWLSTWYENSAYIKIPIEEFDLRTISLTYGDSHPTFSDRINDGAELKYEVGVISIMPAKVPHEVVAGEDGLYLFAKFMPALC